MTGGPLLTVMTVEEALPYADDVVNKWPTGHSQLDRACIAALSAEVRRQAEVIELLQRRMSEQCVYSAGLKAGAAPLHARVAELEAQLVVRDLQVATIKEQMRLAESKRDLHVAAREELTPLVTQLLTVLESAILDLPFEAQTELDLAMLAVRAKLG